MALSSARRSAVTSHRSTPRSRAPRARRPFTAGGAGPPGFSIGKSKLAISAADPSKLYAHYTDKTTFSSLGTYLSTNDGATFSLRSNFDVVTGQGWYNLIFQADPNKLTVEDVKRLASFAVNEGLDDKETLECLGVEKLDDLPMNAYAEATEKILKAARAKLKKPRARRERAAA